MVMYESLDPIQQLLGSLTDFNNIEYGVYRVAMKLRYIQKKTKLCHLNLNTWKCIVEQNFLENPNLVLTPMEISATITSLLQELGLPDSNKDTSVRLLLSLLAILYPQPNLPCLLLNIPIILLSTDDTASKHRMIFELSRVSANGLNLQELTHVLHVLSYLPLVCDEKDVLGEGTSQGAAQACFTFNKVPFHGTVSCEQYVTWVRSDPTYIAWIPTLYRLQQSQFMKHDVKCTLCKAYPILGLRYKCLKCVNLDMCQECFLLGKMYKNHEVSHPLKEYTSKGTTSESIRDLSVLVKNYLKPHKSSKSQKNDSMNRSKDESCFSTIQSEEYYARKGVLPRQAPILRYTSCPDIHPTNTTSSLPLYPSPGSVPPYHVNSSHGHVNSIHGDVITTHDVIITRESLPPEKSIASFTSLDRSRYSPTPVQTIAEIAENFKTDLDIYNGDDRKRQPVISRAGKICVAMETFLGDMASKPVPLQKNGHIPPVYSPTSPITKPVRPFPPPKPKRTSPTATANTSKGSASPDLSDVGVNLHLKYDPSHRTNPGYILPTEKPRKPEATFPKFTVTCSTPTPSHTVPTFDVSFLCSEDILDGVNEQETASLNQHRQQPYRDPSPGAVEEQRPQQRIRGRRSTGSVSPSPKLRNHTISHPKGGSSPRAAGKRNGTSPVLKPSSGNSLNNMSCDSFSRDDNALSDSRSDVASSVSTVTRSIRKLNLYHPPLLKAESSMSDVTIQDEHESTTSSTIKRNYREKRKSGELMTKV